MPEDAVDTEVQGEETPQEQTVAQETTVDKAEYDRVVGELSKKTQDYTNLQGTHQRAVEEGRITQSFAEKMRENQEQNEDMLGVLFDEVAALRQRPAIDEYGQPSQVVTGETPSERLKAMTNARKEQKAETDRLEQQRYNAWVEIKSVLDSEGIEYDDPSINLALQQYQGGNFESSIRMVRDAVGNVKAKKVREDKEAAEEAKLEAERQKLKDEGGLDNTSIRGKYSPSDALPTKKKDFDKFVDSLSAEEYEKRRDEIHALAYSGKLK